MQIILLLTDLNFEDSPTEICFCCHGYTSEEIQKSYKGRDRQPHTPNQNEIR